MVVEASLPQLGTVIVTAAIDSINPCAIGVLLLLISTIVAGAHSRKQMLKMGLIYIAAVYIVYFSAGLGLTLFLAQIPIIIAEYISIAVGLVIIAAGLIEIKDFYWYGQGISLSIPADKAKKINKLARNLSLSGLVLLGAFVAAVELPCTGGPYLAITLILSQNFNLTAVALLAFYNFIFVLPLLVILLLAYFGTKIQDIKMWKHANRAYMRAAIGLLLVVLGWLLMLIANGTINFG